VHARHGRAATLVAATVEAHLTASFHAHQNGPHSAQTRPMATSTAPSMIAVALREPPPLRRARRRTQPATLSPGHRIGTWRVNDHLGRGGMASVYAVTHTKFGKRAALKLAHATILGPAFSRDTFLREARIVNLVDHPGVPDVFATGSFDGRPYLVMERLCGQTLGACLDGLPGPMPRSEAIEILLELCDVLGAAHAAGVVHRDLKLDNVFLLDQPGVGGHRVKLVDWGIARILDEEDPLAGMLAGTLTYVAPEQIRGDDIRPAADRYALGVLAYQMLCGQPPFASPHDLELIKKHVGETPPSPRSLTSDLPADLDHLLLGMLAKRPEDRPSLDQIVATLRAARDRTHRWLRAVPAAPPIDVLGRAAVTLPVPALFAHRLVRASLAIATALAALALHA
jgi:serine/threonine-protein kinase